MGTFIGAGSKEEVVIVCEEEVGYGGGFREMLHPWMRPLFYKSLRAADRPSTHKINKYGDRGSHCLRPREGLKELLSVPLCSTRYDMDCTHYIINRVHLSSMGTIGPGPVPLASWPAQGPS